MAKKYDLIIIGAGPGGYTAALKAAEFGMQVAVIDKDKLGGVCVNRGCIPTKALLYASNIFSVMQHCDDFGVSTNEMSFDFPKMQDYQHRTVNTYRGEIEKLFEKNKIDFIHGTATIRRNHTVEVNTSEGREFYEAPDIIIATGAKAVELPIEGVNLPGVINSDGLLASSTWNYGRVVIVGGGVIGVEFATIFQALCSKVTIVEWGDHLLGPMDREVATQLEQELIKKGISVYCNATLGKIHQDNQGSGLQCLIRKRNGEELTVKASQVIVAGGRKPYMDELLGEDVSLKTDHGKIVVDADFMTSEPGIYAIGDVAAKIQLAHVAAAQGTYVVEKLAGKDHSVQLEVVPNGMFVSLPIVPNCIYTEPEIATVGITEETAKSFGMKVRCGKYSMEGNGKSIIAREESGFIRLIFEAYSNTILGAQMVCPRATDMIGEMATAIANGLTAAQLSKAMRAHPTYSEGIAAAIEDAMKA